MQIRLLGGFVVERGGQPVDARAWRLRKARTLVKMLALAGDQRLHRDVLLDALWPDRDPVSAVNNLHQALHVAPAGARGRRTASNGWLELRDDVVVLRAEGPVEVDVRRFEQLTALARSSGELADLRAAAAAYAGDLLPEDRFEDWAVGPREELRESLLRSPRRSGRARGRGRARGGGAGGPAARARHRPAARARGTSRDAAARGGGPSIGGIGAVRTAAR